MRTTRRLAAALTVALLVAACSPQEVGDAIDEAISVPAEDAPAPESAPPADVGDGSDADAPTGGDSGDAGQDGGSAGEQPADAPADEEPASADEPADEEPAQPQLTPVRDGGPVGANGAAYLRGDRQRVVLEVDVQDGAALPQGVLDHVRSVLDRESNATVDVVAGAASLPRRDAWTANQLRDAAASTRDVAHGDDVAVLHLLVLRDGYEDDGVLGLAFDSSSAVVFPDQWSSLTGLLLSGDRIARAVTVHEVGHLLGLVGLGAPLTADHEDAEHPGHTTDQDDVMYWAVETDLIGSLDGVPDDFGPRTRADLAALREG